MSVNLEARAARAEVEAAEGRVKSARPWFPSAPSLSLLGARRSLGGQTDVNWSATLGVELEVAGQRSARRDAANADREARLKSSEAGARATALAAWQAYFDVLASTEMAALAERLEGGAQRVAEAARARAERGLVSGAEGDLADAAYVRVLQRRLAAQRDVALSRVELATLLGLDSAQSLIVRGALVPLQGTDTAPSAGDAPSAAALEAEGRAFAALAEAERRGRVPNPTVSVFAQRDGFNEQVLGVSLALPLPLPEPLGRMHAGEIAENDALSRRAHYLAQHARRSARARTLRALASYESAGRASEAYTHERQARAETTLSRLAEAVEAGRLSARDAVLLQEPLLEQLLGAVEARRALCVASAQLLWAMNVALEDGAAR